MQLEEIEQYCLSKKGVIATMKFDRLLCYCVGEKIFAAVSIDEVPIRLSIKVNSENFDEIIEDPLYMQAPYFARRQWVTCTNIEVANKKHLRMLLESSYNLIFNKLSKKIQHSILTDA